jgi:hypothetical protein
LTVGLSLSKGRTYIEAFVNKVMRTFGLGTEKKCIMRSFIIGHNDRGCKKKGKGKKKVKIRKEEEKETEEYD